VRRSACGAHWKGKEGRKGGRQALPRYRQHKHLPAYLLTCTATTGPEGQGRSRDSLMTWLKKDCSSNSVASATMPKEGGREGGREGGCGYVRWLHLCIIIVSSLSSSPSKRPPYVPPCKL